MGAERRYQTRTERGGLTSRGSRRQFLENTALWGGSLAVVASGVDYVASSWSVADQVDGERPTLVYGRGLRSLNGAIATLKERGSRTTDQQQVLESAQTIVDLNAANEQMRMDRADQLQLESDEYPVLGLVKRGGLRLWAVGAGVIAIAAGIGSKIARAESR
jgi:hypothetical protein